MTVLVWIAGLVFALLLAVLALVRMGAVDWLLMRKISSWVDERGIVVPSRPPSFPSGDLDRSEFRSAAQELGSDTYVVWSTTRPVLVISDAKSIKTFYSDQAKHTRARDAFMGYIITHMMSQCLGVHDVDHKRMVKPFRAVFNFKFVQQHFALVDEALDRILPTLLESAGDEKLRVRAEELATLPFEVIASFLYGATLGGDAGIAELRAIAAKHGNALSYISSFTKLFGAVLQHAPFYAGNIALRNFQDAWDRFNDVRFEQVRSGKLSREEAPVLAVLLECMESDDEAERLTTAEVYQTLNEIFFTNIEVSSAAIGWALLHVAQQDDVQQQLYEELGREDEGGEGLSPDAIFEHAYLNAVVRESARVAPSVVLTIPEITAVDCVLGGYSIPAGTAVAVDVENFNLRKDRWGEEPATFCPAHMSGRRVAEHEFHRFGLGPRRCLGKYFADIIIKAVLYRLVSRFQLSSSGSPQLRREGLPFFTPMTDFPQITAVERN